MGHVLQSGHIDAPPEKAFAIAIDAARIPGMERLRQRGKGHHRLAGPARQQLRVGPQTRRSPLEGLLEVSRVESPRLLGSPGPHSVVGEPPRRIASRRPPPARDVAIEIEYELPGGFVGGMADKLVCRTSDRT